MILTQFGKKAHAVLSQIWCKMNLSLCDFQVEIFHYYKKYLIAEEYHSSLPLIFSEASTFKATVGI